MRSEQPIPNLKLLSGRDHLLHHEGVRDPGGVPPSHESDGHQTLRVFPLGWRGESESHLLFAGPVLAVRLSSSVSSPALCRTILESTSQKSTRPECPMIAKYWFFKVLMLIHRGFTCTDVSKLG